MLESGEYFGESGVLTYFNGGSKASSTAPPMTEQFCFVARTSVEMLVLRRKHFNIIEIPVIERVGMESVVVAIILRCLLDQLHLPLLPVW